MVRPILLSRSDASWVLPANVYARSRPVLWLSCVNHPCWIVCEANQLSSREKNCVSDVFCKKHQTHNFFHIPLYPLFFGTSFLLYTPQISLNPYNIFNSF